jgi:hypothetical protein
MALIDFQSLSTEARLLGFSYDFGVTAIHHQNVDAMILASALMSGIHPPWLRPIHGVSIMMTNHGVAALRFFMSLFFASALTRSICPMNAHHFEYFQRVNASRKRTG